MKKKTINRKNYFIMGGIAYCITVLAFSFYILISNKTFELSIYNFAEKMNPVISLIFLYMYPFLYYLFFKVIKRVKKEFHEEKGYYRIQVPDNKALNIAKQYDDADNFKLFLKYIIFIIFVAAIYKLCWHNIQKPKIDFVHISKKEWSNNITGLLVTIYAAYFALFPVLSSYLNNRCLFFNIYDLPDIINGNRVMRISIGIFVLYIFAGCIDKASYITHFILALCCVLVLINGLIYLRAFTNPIKIEKRVIKRIDRIYGNKKIYDTPNRTWSKGRTIRQIAILLKEYEKSLEKINIEKIEDINFGCIFSGKKVNECLAKEGYYRIVRVVVGIVVPCTCLVSKSFDTFPNRMIYLILSFVAVIPLLIPLFNQKVIKNNYLEINCVAYNSKWGYYIDLKDKNMYVTSYDCSRSKYGRWIITLKRMVCFFNLALKMKYNDIQRIGSLGMEYICDYVVGQLKTNKYRKGMAIPMLICACVSDENKTIECTIKKVLLQINMDKQEKEITTKVCLQILRDLEANDEEFYKAKYEKKLAGWFEQKNFPKKSLR